MLSLASRFDSIMQNEGASRFKITLSDDELQAYSTMGEKLATQRRRSLKHCGIAAIGAKLTLAILDATGQITDTCDQVVPALR